MTNTFTFGGMPVDLEELAVMDYSHNKIHEGEMFMAHYYAGTLGAGGTIMIHLTAGTVTPHLLWDIAVGGDARLTVTEGGTLTGGTAVTVFNMNRGNAGSCLSTVKHSGTLAGGTVINDFFIPGGSGPTAGGGNQRANQEVVALISKNTSLTVTNITTAYPVSLGIFFYEEAE